MDARSILSVIGLDARGGDTGSCCCPPREPGADAALDGLAAIVAADHDAPRSTVMNKDLAPPRRERRIGGRPGRTAGHSAEAARRRSRRRRHRRRSRSRRRRPGSGGDFLRRRSAAATGAAAGVLAAEAMMACDPALATVLGRPRRDQPGQWHRPPWLKSAPPSPSGPWPSATAGAAAALTATTPAAARAAAES